MREQFHFGRDDGLENGAAFFDDGLEVERVQDGRGALGEFAKLMNKIAGAVTGFKNLFERFAGGMFVGQIEGDEFGAAENAGDEVVEFVGDAGGKFVEREKLEGEVDWPGRSGDKFDPHGHFLDLVSRRQSRQ